MTSDIHGHAMTGATAEAASSYEQAVRAFNVYRGDPLALTGKARAEAPEFAMAHLLEALLLALSTEPEATRQARELMAGVRRLALNERESGVAEAVDRIVAGAWSEAAVALDRHSMRFPRDLVALQAGHLVDFYRANARNLRDRIARAMPHWTGDMPGYAIVLGMRAFGLEETGAYEEAEAVGREAVGLEPADCWAHHAVAHVMEMQGRALDGIGWMAEREAHWSGDANFFQVHNWWHKALFHLDLGQMGEVLALYDGPIRRARSAVVLDLIDASALLWRLQAGGADVGERWAEVARAFEVHADGRTYPFNDWHAAMAYLGAGRHADVEQLLERLRETQAESREASGWAGTARALIEGFAAFARGDHATAVERLHGARSIANGFGGSHAQRDVIDWTLAEAALRGGLREVAVAIGNERMALKPHSTLVRSFLARAQSVGGERLQPAA